MHLLALTAGAALASIAPATAPPGAPPAGAVPAGTYTLEDSFAGDPLHRDVDGAGGLDATSPKFNVLWAFDDTAYIIPDVHRGPGEWSNRRTTFRSTTAPGRRAT